VLLVFSFYYLHSGDVAKVALFSVVSVCGFVPNLMLRAGSFDEPCTADFYAPARRKGQ